MSETEHKAIVDIYGDGPIEHKKSCKFADCKSELTAQRIADLEQQLSEVTAERDRLQDALVLLDAQVGDYMSKDLLAVVDGTRSALHKYSALRTELGRMKAREKKLRDLANTTAQQLEAAAKRLRWMMDQM